MDDLQYRDRRIEKGFSTNFNHLGRSFFRGFFFEQVEVEYAVVVFGLNFLFHYRFGELKGSFERFIVKFPTRKIFRLFLLGGHLFGSDIQASVLDVNIKVIF